MQCQAQWSIAILSSRESPHTLAVAIRAAVQAASDSNSLIDVLVNGNESLASLTSDWLNNMRNPGWPGVRLWYISAGDKANAWNEYVYAVWPGSVIAFFVDGYVSVAPDAFRLLAGGLGGDSHALAAAAVPTEGRTAKALRTMMVRDGGMHGNLYAVKGDTLAVLRERGFRLPLGIYRSDATLGAALAFGLDPSVNRWDARRVLVHPRATWKVFRERRGPLRVVQGTWARIMRQAQGVLENAAVRDHFSIRRCRPESLPRTCHELVQSWINSDPDGARRIFHANYLARLAWRRLRTPRDWSDTEHAPRLLAYARGTAGDEVSIDHASA
jgi:hypothetical protein